MMTERQITAFRQVMRLGSVTAAAKALSVSQLSDQSGDLGVGNGSRFCAV